MYEEVLDGILIKMKNNIRKFFIKAKVIKL